MRPHPSDPPGSLPRFLSCENPIPNVSSGQMPPVRKGDMGRLRATYRAGPRRRPSREALHLPAAEVSPRTAPVPPKGLNREAPNNSLEVPVLADHPVRIRPGAIVRTALLLLGALISSHPATPVGADRPAPPFVPGDSWQNAERMTPEELVRILRSSASEKPVLFHVGFRVLFAQAHIPGSQYAGPGSSQTGLDALRKAVATTPKTTMIVLYCGCCPWERCPNLEQPWRTLVAAGFTRVKVLYIPKNFGQDWVQKGYPVEPSEPSHG